jgi:hypothetical protein
MYEVKLLKGTEALRTWPTSSLSQAGQAYVHPGMLAPVAVIARATTVTLTTDRIIIGGLRRKVSEQVWILSVDCPHRIEIQEISYELLHKPLEKAHKQILAWFPHLDPWRAVAIASNLRDCAFMRLSKWVTLDIVEVDPNYAELERLKKEQATDEKS